MLEQQASTENIYLFSVGNLSVLGKIDVPLKYKYTTLTSPHIRQSSSKLKYCERCREIHLVLCLSVFLGAFWLPVRLVQKGAVQLL